MNYYYMEALVSELADLYQDVPTYTAVQGIQALRLRQRDVMCGYWPWWNLPYWGRSICEHEKKPTAYIRFSQHFILLCQCHVLVPAAAIERPSLLTLLQALFIRSIFANFACTSKTPPSASSKPWGTLSASSPSTIRRSVDWSLWSKKIKDCCGNSSWRGNCCALYIDSSIFFWLWLTCRTEIRFTKPADPKDKVKHPVCLF